MASKRLKKNVSFSEHEEDIYDYLCNDVKNASALIKRLVYNHMIVEKGLVAPSNLKINFQNKEEVDDKEEEEIKSVKKNSSSQQSNEKNTSDKKTREVKIIEEEKEDNSSIDKENQEIALELDL